VITARTASTYRSRTWGAWPAKDFQNFGIRCLSYSSIVAGARPVGGS
jgi:hypothetical protein